MAKGKDNTDVRIEIWLPEGYLKSVMRHIKRKYESRKKAIERITKRTIEREMKLKHKPLYK